MGSPRPLKTRPSMSRATGSVSTFPMKRTFVLEMSMPDVPSKTYTNARVDSIFRFNDGFSRNRVNNIVNRYMTEDAFVKRCNHFFIVFQFRTSQPAQCAAVLLIDDHIM